ncbi:hypothetical protein BaRGS_00032488 [Batillaria attramentaria]|uniref:Secreted protein n=1 Tax=Batillaria attramentaria TaxID=370345 RepID=A0ABD0JNS1_9CAEN
MPLSALCSGFKSKTFFAPSGSSALAVGAATEGGTRAEDVQGTADRALHEETTSQAPTSTSCSRSGNDITLFRPHLTLTRRGTIACVCSAVYQ